MNTIQSDTCRDEHPEHQNDDATWVIPAQSIGHMQ